MNPRDSLFVRLWSGAASDVRYAARQLWKSRGFATVTLLTLALCIGANTAALFLSALGIYGVLTYDVSQRTREIGVRGAIGATQHQVIGLVMRQGLWKTITGLVIGLVGAVLLSGYLKTQLYQVSPTDPRAYVVVSLVLLFVAALASYLPARRAARINPIDALRVE